MDWVAEYEIIPTNLPFCLSLVLKNWCIIVEEEVGEIDLPIMEATNFQLYRRTLDLPPMPEPTELVPGAPTDSLPAPIYAPSPAP